MSRLGMVLNLDRCIGCWACAVACKMENSIGEGLWWQEIKTIGGADIDTSAGVFPNVSKHYQPRNCFHCAEPACPYDAIEMNQFAPVLPTGLEQGHGAAEVPPRRAHVVEKCTFCSHRVDQGLQPACVEACPTQVITFGDVDDPDSAVARQRAKPGAFRIDEQSGAEPSVWFLPALAGAKQRRSG